MRNRSLSILARDLLMPLAMSEGLNQVHLIGNLGADPELRMTQNGHAMLKFRLATTEVYHDKDQKKQSRNERSGIA
jgi:single-stranded DNA-binding protein